MIEFETTLDEPRPRSEFVVVYTRKSGQIVHMHEFIGDGTGLFGPEGREERAQMALSAARHQHTESEPFLTLHVPSDFQFDAEHLYRVEPRTRKLVIAEKAVPLSRAHKKRQ